MSNSTLEQVTNPINVDDASDHTSILGPPSLPPAAASVASNFSAFQPALGEDGLREPKEAFSLRLAKNQRKNPLIEALNHFEIPIPPRPNIKGLCGALINHWYPVFFGPELPPPNPPNLPPVEADYDISESELVAAYDVGSGVANEIFGALASGGLEDEDEDEDEDFAEDLTDDAAFKRYLTSVRVSAAQRTEKNRRRGGIKTQKAVVKSFKIFRDDALEKKLIRDHILDEHALLLFIEWSANRCKRNRRGEYIPNTRIGASQLKKEFFGALRIRKLQDAQDPSLAFTRPATTVHVYDAIKTRMDEALRNAREGLIEDEDATDIIANTFLDQLSDDTLVRIRYGFLEHRELKATINGFLAWTMMNASGNRGDDIRALRLCEMQPHFLMHPNNETCIPAVLGLQSDMEQKAKRKGMSTTVNPTYTCFIAHRDAEMCPVGAFALYLHYVHDVANIDSKYNIDYTKNKSWRAIRLIHGSSATAPYNETALQNLFCQSYKKAGIKSRLKAHLARHMLGYQQEKMGVSADQTTKLGWSKDTYLNTYAPALPKVAILAAHGYKEHETYDPAWTHVDVPESFLSMVCPNAEHNVSLVKGKENLLGATNYWEMVISLRPYLFQAAAAIYQVRPNSSIFRLPALASKAVQTWMKDVFPQQLEAVKAKMSPEVDLTRLQDKIMRQAFEQMRDELALQRKAGQSMADEIKKLTSTVERRTSSWTPAKAVDYSVDSSITRLTASELHGVSRQLNFSSGTGHPCTPLAPMSDIMPVLGLPFTRAPDSIDEETCRSEDSGIYTALDDTLRAFVVPSPTVPNRSRPRTEVDLVLPPLSAFCNPGEDLPTSHPFLGRHSVHWSDVFAHIKQPVALWDVWHPEKTLDQMSVKEIWNCYNVGEPKINNGVPTGMKPPLRLVEQAFQSEWRKTEASRKAWQRFREIPEWIDSKIHSGFTETEALEELEHMREVPGKRILLGSSGLSNLIKARRKEVAATQTSNIHVEGAGNSDATTDGKKRRAPVIGGRRKRSKSNI